VSSTDGDPDPTHPTALASPPGLGLVVIGRNEGERLKACLRSVRSDVAPVVYVDSGSTDGSVEAARALGADVVELDMTRPFTAARARNAGFDRLLERAPATVLVQFVDGDCEVQPGWLEAGVRALEADPAVVAVCGRIRERHPERSIYNALCQLEWDSPTGFVPSCGGNAMLRVAAFRAVGGFRPDLIAGEEPDLCQRLRDAGGRILKIPCEMVTHDADLLRYWQWWRRAVRWGYASAQLAHLHARAEGPHGWRTTLNSAFWTVGLPATTLAATRVTPAASVALAAYPLRMVRLYVRERQRGRAARVALAYATLNTTDKVAQLFGAARYGWAVATGRKARIIEHKPPPR